MEQKTAEEILEYHYDTSYASIKIAMQEYAKQQQEIAVEKALEVVEDKFKTLKEKSINLKDMLYLDGVMAVISTSKPEILKELEK